MSFFSVFSPLVSVFARLSQGLSQHFQSIQRLFSDIVSFSLVLSKYFLCIKLIVFKYLSYRIWAFPIYSYSIMIQLQHQFIIFSILMIMPAGLAWDHLFSQVPCPRLRGSSGCDKTQYQSSRFESRMMSEKATLSRVLFIGVKCTTSNEREAMKCFSKNITFLLLLLCVWYD